MILYLARHAQTNYNVAGLCNADPSIDVHLTDLGKAQAAELAAKLANEQFQAIYISELPRTRQTAEIVNAGRNIPLMVDKRINDNRTGYEGLPVTEWQAALDASENKWTASFNGGESLEDAKSRVRDFLSSLSSQPYEAVLVVTHGYVTQCVHGILNNLTNDETASYQLAQGDFAKFDI